MRPELTGVIQYKGHIIRKANPLDDWFVSLGGKPRFTNQSCKTCLEWIDNQFLVPEHFIRYQVVKMGSGFVTVQLRELVPGRVSVLMGELVMGHGTWSKLRPMLDQLSIQNLREVQPAVKLDNVKSTVFKQVGYDADKQELVLVFVSGKKYTITNFPPDKYRRFRKAKSLGRYYNQHIRDNQA